MKEIIMLPQEVIIEIFSRLPVKSLLRLQCLSKPWFALINEQTFIIMHAENNRERNLILQTLKPVEISPWPPLHLNYYLVNISSNEEDQPVEIFPPFYHPEILSSPKIINCCNGLVCFRTNGYNRIVIWNPSIRKYKQLPFEPIVSNSLGIDNFAFGYDAINNDFKVLRIMEYFAGDVEVDVYSLKASSWRRVEPRWPYKGTRIWSGPVYLNDALRWLALITATRENRFLTFNVTNEKFHQHDTMLPFEWQLVQTLDLWGGSLYVSAYGLETSEAIEFWRMIETDTFLNGMNGWRVVLYSMDGKKVLMEWDMGDGNKNLFWYDLKRKTFSDAHAPTNVGNNIWTMTCVGSLFLLDGDSVRN